MFNLEDLKMGGERSRTTSASTGFTLEQAIQGGSLSTILQQSLQSEDKDQLDWILQQNDPAMIDKTLLQLKQPKVISALFKHMLVKYQEQNIEDTMSLTVWLRQLLRIHWVTLLKTSPALLMENIQALQGLKQVIKVKTECLHDMISLKGKLEMLKTTFQMQDPSQKYQKIKNNLKK